MMGDHLKKLRLDVKHQWRHLRVTVIQNVTVKHVVVTVIGVISCFIVFLIWSRWPQKVPNSAVACKSKIQQVLKHILL